MATANCSPASLGTLRSKDEDSILKDRGWRNGVSIAGTGAREPAATEFIKRCQSFPYRENEIASFLTLIKSCTKNKDLLRGIQVHEDILKLDLLEECSGALITMYAKCGAMPKAKNLVDQHKIKDVFSWTALIAAYARHGQCHEALSCFDQMTCEGLSPDAVTFSCVLKACGSIQALETGEKIHHEIARQGLLGNDNVLGAALVDMYAKCGAIEKAECVLNELSSCDVVPWNVLIGRYAQQGQSDQALRLFHQMPLKGITPSETTFTCILKACGAIRVLEKGEQIHREIERQGLLASNIILDTALVDMYAKCGTLRKAHQLLEELPFRDVVCWSALIAGYAHQGHGEQALACFNLMKAEGLSPNAVTFACALNACGIIKDIVRGELLHDEISRQGLVGTNIVLDTALVDMYAKCGALEKAHHLLENIPSRNVVSWNSLIEGYLQRGDSELALTCYENMQSEGLSPDGVTYSSALKACAAIGSVDRGEEIHNKISQLGLLKTDMLLGSSVIDMYAKCGALGKAHKTLADLNCRDSVCWNSLIAGYSKFGQSQLALKCYRQMQHESHSPDIVTYISILQACGNIRAIDEGDRIYNEICRQGYLKSSIELGSAVVDMYVKFGLIAKAEQILKQLPSRNAISWNSLIVGYAMQGEGEQAWSCYERMQSEGLSPDVVTYASILKAVSMMGAVSMGEQIHDEIAKQGLLENDIVLGTALVNMYCKCGAIVKAQGVLEKLHLQDIVLWNTLITGFVQQGHVKQAMNCLERMYQNGFLPNAVTLSSVLNGCSHLGLVEDASEHFMKMNNKYGIEPDLEHYTCMVDLLGRAGHLHKAVQVIQQMPLPDCSILCALLGACRIWKDVNVGRWAFQETLKIDRSDGAAYILMADIYAAVGLQGDAAAVESLRMRNVTWNHSHMSLKMHE